MAEIIPAIIPKNFDDLREKVFLVKDYASLIQVDITDGVFAQSKSWPFFGGVKEKLSGNFEFDLMVKNPEETLSDWIDLGAKRIVVHIESTNRLEEIIRELKGRIEIGVAFNINTPFDKILEDADFVQLMGIEKIGFQGEKFSEKVFDKIKKLRKFKSDVIISIDGGVNLENAQKLIEAGANRLVVGSAIFESDNVEETINKLKSY